MFLRSPFIGAPMMIITEFLESGSLEHFLKVILLWCQLITAILSPQLPVLINMLIAVDILLAKRVSSVVECSGRLTSNPKSQV